MIAAIKQLAATGSVVGDTHNTVIKSITLTAGSDTATLVLKQGGSSGTAVLSLSAVTNTSTSVYFGDGGIACPGAHITLTGTARKASVAYI
jgi:ABC-type Co2+ transport system permease subunit